MIEIHKGPNRTWVRRKLEEAAFNAGREYHSPGYDKPILRYKSFDSWLNCRETYLHYGQVKERQRDSQD
jgi:hypothetical protein